MKAIFIHTTLLMALLLQLTARPVVFFHWKWNQKRIAAELCENRAKPKMNCNGKCYLAKQLQKVEADKSSESKRPFQSNLPEVELYVVPILGFNKEIIVVVGDNNLSVFKNYFFALSTWKGQTSTPPPNC